MHENEAAGGGGGRRTRDGDVGRGDRGRGADGRRAAPRSLSFCSCVRSESSLVSSADGLSSGLAATESIAGAVGSGASAKAADQRVKAFFTGPLPRASLRPVSDRDERGFAGLLFERQDLARGEMLRLGFEKSLVVDAAGVAQVAAARMEAAARRRLERARDVAGQQDALAALFDGGIGDGHGGKQGFRVRMLGIVEKGLRVGRFDDPSQVHHGDLGAEMADDREIVGDEQVREIALLLKVLEKVQYLSLDGDIKGRDGLVGDDQEDAWHQ